MSHFGGFRIKQLEGWNYDTWKVYAKAYLVKEDLWDVVIAGPNNVNVEDLYKVGAATSWKSNDKALAILQLMLDERHVMLMRTCVSAKAVWDTLAKLYQSLSSSRRQTLLKDMHTIYMQPEESLTDYLVRHDTTRERLLQAGVIESDERVVKALVEGLTPQYQDAVRKIDVSKLKYDLVEVRSKLLQYAGYRQSANASHRHEMGASSRNRSRPSNKTRSKGHSDKNTGNLAARLATMPEPEQKQHLGELLFPKIQSKFQSQKFSSKRAQKLASKVTGMFLEMEPDALLYLLDDPPELELKMSEALKVLEDHNAFPTDQDD